MLRLVTVILLIAAIEARIFNNPVLGSGQYETPGAIELNGVYYITSQVADFTLTEKIAIHESTDLINWKLAGYIFDETNIPLWAANNIQFWGAKIHKIDKNYVVYFDAYYKENKKFSIGAAVAPHPLGPYTATDRPLITDIDEHYYPTIANDNGNLYLLWDDNHYIYGRELNTDGLSFASDQIIELLRSSLSWEESYVRAPWYFQRGGYHYILYTGSNKCGTRAIGVARSVNVMGPYEKQGNPILKSNQDFIDPSYNTLVPDLNDDAIVFQVQRAGAECNEYVVAMATLGWNSNAWPIILDY